MSQEKDHLVGLFDGRGHDFVSSYLNDTLADNLKMELRRLRQGEEFSTAIRRAFLSTNRDLSTQPVDMCRWSTACLLYLLENQLIVANVGDTMAVLSREGTAYVLTTKHHPWARGEQKRIRVLGGFISLQGQVEGDMPITRAFGHHHLLPYVNANPSINEVLLGPTDEFVLIATNSFWKVMSYQMAVDVARKERSDPDVAVQKLRDMAIARGVADSMKIVFVDFRGITTQHEGGAAVAERRRNAFRRDVFDDQVLSRLEDEIPPPKPPCAFVFTDIKESTKLWSMLPNAMRVATRQHNNIMRRLMRIHGGYEVKTEGDAFVVAFQSGVNALRFCVAVQQQFIENDWPREILNSPVAAPVYGPDGNLLYRGLSVRMGIHFGMTDDEEDKVARRMDYHGVHMIIAARVSALADGGQIHITDTIREMYTRMPEKEQPNIAIFDLGLTNLKGLPNPEHLYVV
jgi:adenylate cyclase